MSLTSVPVEFVLVTYHASRDVVFEDYELVKPINRREPQPVAHLVARHDAADKLVVGDGCKLLQVVVIEAAGVESKKPARRIEELFRQLLLKLYKNRQKPRFIL